MVCLPMAGGGVPLNGRLSMKVAVPSQGWPRADLADVGPNPVSGLDT